MEKLYAKLAVGLALGLGCRKWKDTDSSCLVQFHPASNLTTYVYVLIGNQNISDLTQLS